MIRERDKASFLYLVSIISCTIFGAYLVDTIYLWPDIKVINIAILILSFIIITMSSTILENIFINLKD